MSSILPNFDYDIFISYRHNDNRGGWVTDFVNALQEELAATIKEPLSIYFDKNPHDGLLETHNVDKSLEGKLKCLIFIPIISQTYCDTKSFAWRHEFVAFNKLSKDDQFGRDINYVVEGSVRKSDNGLRITAQLIRAKDGFHIWSNTYDRDSKDIFKVQQEIAFKIAGSLDISLDPKAVEQKQWTGTNDPEAFVAFLKGQVVFNEAHVKRRELLPYLKRANVDFDEAIRLDPAFINPYLYKGDFYFHYLVKNARTVYNDTITQSQAYQLMRESIESAIAKSTSEMAKDYYRLYSIMYSNDWSPIRALGERVLKSPEAVHLFSYQPYNLTALLTCLGYGEQNSRISRAAVKKDPLNHNRKREIVEIKMFSGDYAQAIENIDSVNTIYKHFKRE